MAQPAPPGPDRPTGVTLLAVLEFLSGAVAFAAAAVLTMVAPRFVPTAPRVILTTIGGVAAVLGVAYFVCGWGLVTRQAWSWTAALVLAAFGLVLFPLGTVLGVLVIYYLTRPHVKRWFGQARRAQSHS